MIAQVQEIDGNKVAVPISGSIPTGLPVGTWISFEKDQAPDNKWIKAGETFDENLYPALYLFLVTNVVPERFDHNRLGTLTSIAMTANTEITMDYDGVVMFCARRSSSVAIFYLNNVQMTNAGGSNSDSWQITIPFKKGDKIKSSQNITVATGVNVDANSCWVAYYSHPMFIKATSAIEITDQNTFLNTVQSLVQTANSYSTEETATGGFWIDGKTIYRKCYVLDITSGTSATIQADIKATLGIDFVTKLYGIFNNNAGSVGLNYYYSSSDFFRVLIDTQGKLLWQRGSSTPSLPLKLFVILEYTKTGV
jgi:hypothetical protein